MATFDENWIAYLLANGAIKAVVGTQIFPGGVVPEGEALPALTSQRLPSRRVRSLNNASAAVDARYQLVAWASTFLAARALADVVIGQLNGLQGAVGTFAGITVLLEDDSDNVTPMPSLEAASDKGVRMDFTIWYGE